jgi:hypothetical protein
MRWFISVSLYLGVIAAGVCYAPAALACPLCFASSGPGVLRAYLVSAFFMIALAWGVIGAITLYAFHVYSEKSEQADTNTCLEVVRSIESPTVPVE